MATDRSERREGSVRQGVALVVLSVRQEPAMFALACAGAALYAAMTVLSAVVFGLVTDRVVVPAFREGRADTGAIWLGAAAVVGVAAVKATGIVVRRLAANLVVVRLQASYRRKVTRQYLRLPFSWHQQHSTGELLSNANSDVESMFFPLNPLPLAVGVVIMLVASMVLIFVTDWVLGLIGLLVFPALAFANARFNAITKPLATQAQEMRGLLSGRAHESFDGAVVVKTLGREDAETARFREQSEELRDSVVAVSRVRARYDPIIEALPTVGVLLVLLIGAERVAAGALVPGELVRVSYLFTLLSFPVRALGWVLSELPRAVVGWERVRRVLEAEGASTYGEVRLPADGAARVDVDALSFGYEPGSPVLHDVAVDVPAGRTIAVVGPTGSGKSTLASLLVRLVDPQAGAVEIDGTDVRLLARGQLSEHVSLVPQHAFLFDDTVRGNVTLGADVADDDVWAALRLAQADRFVDALPHGLDTLVGERGTTLSGGQRQRLALARALVRRPRLLVLDDATSSVDPVVEQAILAGLRDSDLPSTVVVVAYRRATIALADEVVYVEHGRVQARAAHAELLERSPGYARLVTAYDRLPDDPEGAEPAA
jgi:ABC-type multidrug transport system fused ATPase/permease subunit